MSFKCNLQRYTTGVGSGVGADTFAFRRSVTLKGIPSVGHEVRVVVDTKAGLYKLPESS